MGYLCPAGISRTLGRRMLKFRVQNPDSVGVASTTVAPAAAPPNGGFPEPWAGAPVQLVRCRHEACGETTLVRLPPEVPTRAVRVVVCGSCQRSFEVGDVEALGALAPARRERTPAATALPKGSKKPRPPRSEGTGHSLLDGRWGLVAVPVALAAVVGGLLLVQGGGSSTSPQESQLSAAPAIAASGTAAGGGTAAPQAPPVGSQAQPSPQATLVRGASYTLALPGGWLRTTPPSGATFAAHSADGSADATLWIQRDSSLDFPTFEAQSLGRLRQLAGSAHVVDRVPAPTADGTIVRLAADAPAGKPAYDVTLRVAGPYRYYLATTLDPKAPGTSSKAIELISNSLTPTVAGKASP